jgi:2-oxoglutarate ferredoxin oxidoreductase subunit beta
MSQLTSQDFRSPQHNDWCAGCGDFAILKALQKALADLQLPPDRVAVFGGIGCSGKTPYYLSTNGIHTLHGRVLPFASGARLADPGLTVIAVGGDGDGLGIGAGHLVNSARHNLDLTYILFDNGVYGLTKGQPAPTLQRGEQTRSMPHPARAGRLNPLAMALAAGYTWIGRGYAYAVEEMTDLFAAAISHPGLAFIDVLQPCPTYNDLHTREWYDEKDVGDGEPRLYRLAENGYDGHITPAMSDSEADTVRQHCFEKTQQWGMHIPLGVFLQDTATPSSTVGPSGEENTVARRPAPIADDDGHSRIQLADCYGDLLVNNNGCE